MKRKHGFRKSEKLQYINYAYSGAKSGYDNVYFTGWSGLLWQFETFINNTPLIPTGLALL